MKRLGLISIAFVLLANGLSMSSANATVYENQISVELKKVSVNSKELSSAQLKLIKKNATAKNMYSQVFCWAYAGVNVTTKQKKNLHILAKSVCKEVNKLTANLTGGTMPTFEDEDLGATEVTVGFTISELRRITYGGSGDLPTSSAPVAWNKKVTLSDPGNLENNGLEFLGWTKNSDGSGTLYQPGDKISLKRPLTLFAKWDGYTVEMSVLSLGSESISYLGFNYFSPYATGGYLSEFAQTGLTTQFEIGGFNGITPQIRIAAPGSYAANSLTGTGGVQVSIAGWGTCGWALDGYNLCTSWLVTVTGDGTLTYIAAE